MPTEHTVDLRWEGALCEAEAAEATEALLAEAHSLLDALATRPEGVERGSPLELSILLTDDGGIRPLNERWRDNDAATDVLSFPMDEGALLGDVVISVETALGRVGEEWQLGDELLFLLIHGLLHLVGHDHHEPEEQAEMEQAEQALWTALGRPGTLRGA